MHVLLMLILLWACPKFEGYFVNNYHTEVLDYAGIDITLKISMSSPLMSLYAPDMGKIWIQIMTSKQILHISMHFFM